MKAVTKLTVGLVGSAMLWLGSASISVTKQATDWSLKIVPNLSISSAYGHGGGHKHPHRHHRHGRVKFGIYIGPGFGPGYYPGYYGPRYYPRYYGPVCYGWYRGMRFRGKAMRGGCFVRYRGAIIRVW